MKLTASSEILSSRRTPSPHEAVENIFSSDSQNQRFRAFVSKKMQKSLHYSNIQPKAFVFNLKRFWLNIGNTHRVCFQPKTLFGNTPKSVCFVLHAHDRVRATATHTVLHVWERWETFTRASTFCCFCTHRAKTMGGVHHTAWCQGDKKLTFFGPGALCEVAYPDLGFKINYPDLMKLP